MPIEKTLDGSILFDDYVREEGDHLRPVFMGTSLGVCYQGLAETKKNADFAWFEYSEME